MNLPEKDLTKYKTTEAHLDWGKVAFNTYSAEMCKQKWLEVSREVRLMTKYSRHGVKNIHSSVSCSVKVWCRVPPPSGFLPNLTLVNRNRGWSVLGKIFLSFVQVVYAQQIADKYWEC